MRKLISTEPHITIQQAMDDLKSLIEDTQLSKDVPYQEATVIQFQVLQNTYDTGMEKVGYFCIVALVEFRQVAGYIVDDRYPNLRG